MGRASSEQIRLVRFLYADHGGIIRGKAAGTARLKERMSSGIGHTVAMMAMSMLDQLQPVAGMGPVGEVRIVPDPETFVALPYAPGAGAMLADLVLPDGSPWEACARTFLKQAIIDLAGEGYAMQAAFEPEFTIGRRESSPAGPSIPDRLIPIDDSLCYSATGFHLAHDFTMELVEAMEAQGLPVEHYYPELGHGQHELSIRHADALRAADNHVLYRETVRGTAFRHGLWASLAPKPIPDQAGNGTHLHASLLEASADGESSGRNAFADPADRNGLSQVGYHFIGGLLAHVPALVALTCASVGGRAGDGALRGGRWRLRPERRGRRGHGRGAAGAGRPGAGGPGAVDPRGRDVLVAAGVGHARAPLGQPGRRGPDRDLAAGRVE